MFYYNKKKLTFFSLCLGLTTNSLLSDFNENFNTAKNLYLASFSSHESPAETENISNKNLTFQIKELSPQEQRSIAFNLIKKGQISIEKETSTDSTFFKKIEAFSGEENKTESLFNKITSSQTIAGEAVLTRMLTQPTFSIETLQERQAIISALLENPDVFQELDALLQEIKKAEPLLYLYFQKELPVNEALFKKVYFGDWLNFLNKNSLALELGTRWNNLWSALGCTWLPLLTTLASSADYYQKAKIERNPISKTKALTTAVKDNFLYLDPRLKAYKNISSLSKVDLMQGKVPNPLTIGDQIYQLELLEKIEDIPVNPKILFLFMQSLRYGIYAFTTHGSYTQLKLRNDITTHLQTRLIGVNNFIKNTQALYSIITTNENLAPLEKDLASINLNLQGKLKNLVNLLNHRTFKGKASFFSLTGRVLAAHTLMNEVKEELSSFIELVGTIDAYVSITKIYQKHQATSAKYCFVKFIENNKPYLLAKNFWNPFINPNIVVTNSIEIGGEKPNNITLTGPNTGGKSTIIKGLIIDILLAQTFGIVPAEDFYITPFADINCYLNITDDISAGTSLFKAEVLRAKKLIDGVRALKPNEFSFTIMDEVFSGTSPKEGKQAAYKYAEALAKIENSICCIATHFKNLIELEQTSFYKNYHVSVTKNENGSWHRPFKLEEGFSFQNIALDLLQEEGIF